MVADDLTDAKWQGVYSHDIGLVLLEYSILSINRGNKAELDFLTCGKN